MPEFNTISDPHERQQAMFDIVWQAFVIDKAPAAWDSSRRLCRYLMVRKGQECRCSVGLLLPRTSEVNRLAMKVKGSVYNFDVINEAGELRDSFAYFYEDAVFLSALQDAHDVAANPKSFGRTAGSFYDNVKERLQGIARNYELSIPEVAEVSE